MKPDDQSLLSAYLDGQLAPEQHRAIESCLADDSRLAEEIQSLRHARDLVSELSRPVPPDLSSAVMARVRARLLRRRPWHTRRYAVSWVAGGLGAAAAVVLFLLLQAHPSAPGPNVAAKGGRVPEAHQGVGSPVANEQVADSEPERPADSGRSGPPAATSDNARESGSRIAGDSSVPEPERVARELRTFRELLDNPALRKVFLITDQVGDASEHQVESIVERTTRQEYFRATVSQGIVIDPRHPGKAVVFAVVLERNELEPFRNRLRADFKDRFHEEDVDPAITLQLADVGQVVALPAHPVGDVTIPPTAGLALRAGRREDPGSVDHALASLAADSDQPTLEQERSRPDSDLVISGRDGSVSTGGSHDATQTDAHPGSRETASAGDGDRAPGGEVPRTIGAGPARTASRAGTPSHFPVDDRRLLVLVWIAEGESG
jgi:hypothetical protein